MKNLTAASALLPVLLLVSTATIAQSPSWPRWRGPNGENLDRNHGVDLSRQEFYERLPWMDPQPTTSTASSGTYQQVYDSLFMRGAKYILSIHPPSSLSGIINSASMAAQAFNKRVHILDSGMVSLGLGFQVRASPVRVLKRCTSPPCDSA